MHFWGLSDPGMVRAQNQDAYQVVQLDRNTLLGVVCDGMGGAKSGNIASSLAVDVFVEEIRHTWTSYMDQEKVDQMMKSAAKLANFTVFDQSQQFEEFDGMGTTLVAVLIRASQRFWVEASANVNMLHTNSYAVIESEEETPLLNSNTLCAYSAMVKPRVKFDNMDASVAYELTLEDNRGTYLSVNNKEQWQHHIQGRLTWRLPWSLSLDAAVNYHNYTTYLSADSRMDWLMMDFSIERPFLKGKNLFVELSAHDLLNENNGFSRVYDATSLTHTYNKVLGRYAMLSVRYRFATKKK